MYGLHPIHLDLDARSGKFLARYPAQDGHFESGRARGRRKHEDIKEKTKMRDGSTRAVSVPKEQHFACRRLTGMFTLGPIKDAYK